jgi:hypothetical protein
MSHWIDLSFKLKDSSVVECVEALVFPLAIVTCNITQDEFRAAA